MSTTFNIIPTKVDNDLTFKNVLALAKESLQTQLDNLSISLSIDLAVNIHDVNEDYENNINPDTKFVWQENEYAWFTVDNFKGGTDAYCKKIADSLSDWNTYIEETLTNINLTPEMKQNIINCEYEWYFRRSMGQPPIINLAYGHLAAAVARITKGYIYTYDGAWHDDIFPASAEDFLAVYFYPDKANHPGDYNWVTGCLAGLRS